MHYIREQLLGITSLLLPCGSSGSKSIISLGSKHLPTEWSSWTLFLLLCCLETDLLLAWNLPRRLTFSCLYLSSPIIATDAKFFFRMYSWDLTHFLVLAMKTVLRLNYFLSPKLQILHMYWDASVRSLGIHNDLILRHHFHVSLL